MTADYIEGYEQWAAEILDLARESFDVLINNKTWPLAEDADT